LSDVKKTLRLAVSGWILIQLAGLAAAPIALCATAPATATDSHACCPGVGPGQICPMHKTREGASRCTMTSACQASDATLLSLFTSIGITPPSSVTVDASSAGDRVLALVEQSIVRASAPDPQPPRL
jgi:hypothetical protein